MTRRSHLSLAHLSLAISLMALTLLSACASGGATSTSTRGTRDVIVAEELRAQPSGSVYEAIQRLRPRWLQTRGISSTRSNAPSPAQVYLDGASLGPIGSLRSISVNNAQRIQFLNAADATTRFGTGHDGGAILVSTRSGG